MIGSLVEYIGTYEELHGKKGIVVSVAPSLPFPRAGTTWEVNWVSPVEFAGRRTTRSRFRPSEFMVVSEVSHESK
jgi:hypothetical protein